MSSYPPAIRLVRKEEKGKVMQGFEMKMNELHCQENPEGVGLGCARHPFRRIPMDNFAVVGGFISPNYSGGGVLEWAESMEMATYRAKVLSECEFTEELGPYDMTEEM